MEKDDCLIVNDKEIAKYLNTQNIKAKENCALQKKLKYEIDTDSKTF